MYVRGARCCWDRQPDLSDFWQGARKWLLGSCIGWPTRHHGPRQPDFPEIAGFCLVSTTHGAENHALAAARTCLRVSAQDPVQHILDDRPFSYGRLQRNRMRSGCWGADCRVWLSMQSGLCHDLEGNVSLPMRTLFLQEVNRRRNSDQLCCAKLCSSTSRHETTLPAMRRRVRCLLSPCSRWLETLCRRRCI